MEHISNYKNAIIESSSVPIQSGINFIDDELGGYHPGELMTICGTEDCGKSAFIIAQVDKIAVQLLTEKRQTYLETYADL